MLRRENHHHNIKKIYRIYKEEGLVVKRRKGRKRAIGTRQPLPKLDSVNQVAQFLGSRSQPINAMLLSKVKDSLLGLRLENEKG